MIEALLLGFSALGYLFAGRYVFLLYSEELFVFNRGRIRKGLSLVIIIFWPLFIIVCAILFLRNRKEG